MLKVKSANDLRPNVQILKIARVFLELGREGRTACQESAIRLQGPGGGLEIKGRAVNAGTGECGILLDSGDSRSIVTARVRSQLVEQRFFPAFALR